MRTTVGLWWRKTMPKQRPRKNIGCAQVSKADCFPSLDGILFTSHILVTRALFVRKQLRIPPMQNGLMAHSRVYIEKVAELSGVALMAKVLTHSIQNVEEQCVYWQEALSRQSHCSRHLALHITNHHVIEQLICIVRDQIIGSRCESSLITVSL